MNVTLGRELEFAFNIRLLRPMWQNGISRRVLVSPPEVIEKAGF
jgi:hypothetical protein